MLPEMSKQVEVDGFRYLITHPDPDTAWKMGIDLTKMVAEPFAAMAIVSEDKSKLGESLAKAIKLLLNNIDPQQSLSLIKKLLSYVELQGEVGGDNKKMMMTDPAYKSHFQGRHGSMVKLAVEVLIFQQKDFFAAISGGIAEMMPSKA